MFFPFAQNLAMEQEDCRKVMAVLSPAQKNCLTGFSIVKLLEWT